MRKRIAVSIFSSVVCLCSYVQASQIKVGDDRYTNASVAIGRNFQPSPCGQMWPYETTKNNKLVVHCAMLPDQAWYVVDYSSFNASGPYKSEKDAERQSGTSVLPDPHNEDMINWNDIE